MSSPQVSAELGNGPWSLAQPSWLKWTKVPPSLDVSVQVRVVPTQCGGKSAVELHRTRLSLTSSTVSPNGIGAWAKLGFITEPTPPVNSTVGVHQPAIPDFVSSALTILSAGASICTSKTMRAMVSNPPPCDEPGHALRLSTLAVNGPVARSAGPTGAAGGDLAGSSSLAYTKTLPASRSGALGLSTPLGTLGMRMCS